MKNPKTIFTDTIESFDYLKYTLYMVLGIAFVLAIASLISGTETEGTLKNVAVMAADRLLDVTIISTFIYAGQTAASFAGTVLSLSIKIIKRITGRETKYVE